MNKYHTKVKFKQVVHETQKAYLIKLEGTRVNLWVPKGVCREFDGNTKTVCIHTDFLKTKITEVIDEVKSFLEEIRNFN